MRFITRLHYICVATDQLVNAICGGSPDETISAKCWRLREKNSAWKFLRWIVDKIFWFDPNHCYTSYLIEENRSYLPEEYRKTINNKIQTKE